MIPFIALFAIFIFMLIQAGFSAALMSYSERVWDNVSTPFFRQHNDIIFFNLLVVVEAVNCGKHV